MQQALKFTARSFSENGTYNTGVDAGREADSFCDTADGEDAIARVNPEGFMRFMDKLRVEEAGATIDTLLLLSVPSSKTGIGHVELRHN